MAYNASDTNTFIDRIRTLAHQHYLPTLEMRRHLHANPELSFKEYQTSAFIKATLDSLGIVWSPLAETGVVGIIKGYKPSGKVIALRADMDALPITEQNELSYASRNDGVMHACGHDVHTSSLLGAAAILQSIRDEFGGIIKLIFQPAEEQLPGGASIMIAQGVLKDPAPTCVLGQHVMPFLESGKVALRKGRYMASMDEITMTVFGKGGHSAQPHRNIDPVFIASHIIVSLQQIVSRIADPITPSVLSFGKFIGNGSINITPDKVYLEGTFRTLDENWREEAHVKIKNIATGIAENFGGSCEVNIKRGYPFLVNEEKLTDRVGSYMKDYLGSENVVDTDIWMASEDFAYYSQAVDSCFYLLGTGNKGAGINSSLHSSTFNIEEKSLETSIGLMAYIAFRQLQTTV
jgi:amidohydrolase